jgi:hypothetical protein
VCKRLGNDFPRELTLKAASLPIITSGKIDFKTKLFNRDKEGHFILIKQTIYQEEVTIVNLYTPKVGTTKLI